MACGVPFCQAGVMIAGMVSGCPLQNLVPEWNDLVYSGNWEKAYARLNKKMCIRDRRRNSFTDFPQFFFRGL